MDTLRDSFPTDPVFVSELLYTVHRINETQNAKRSRLREPCGCAVISPARSGARQRRFRGAAAGPDIKSSQVKFPPRPIGFSHNTP